MLKKYKWIWIVGAIVIMGSVAAFFFTRSNGNASEETDIGETAVAFIGDLAESATASGQVQAQRDAMLSLAGSGIVGQVNVAVGDSVTQGDILVRLETAALERDVASAELDVAIAKADLARVLGGPSTAELTAAESAASSAQAKLDKLLAGPSEEEIAASEASVKAAQANVWSASGNLQATNSVSDADILAAEKNLKEAQDAWQEVHNIWVILADCEENDSGSHTCTPKEGSDRMESISEQVQAASADVAIKQAQLDDLLNPAVSSVASSQANVSSASAQRDAAAARHAALLAGASDADIAAAEADLASAKASLDNLISGPSATDLKIYETRLAKAETGLQEAQNALDDAALSAPFDGVITAVHVALGENASGLAVELLDSNSLEVILGVDEIDVGQIAIGQPASVTMETWPNDEIASEITAIAPSSSASDAGLVTYDVHLALNDSDLPILVGMTANADLITNVGEDVLLVPNAAITADRENGTYTVNLVRTEEDGNKTVLPVEVTIGLKDKDHTQVISGLVEGDVVILGTFEAPTLRFGPGGGGDGGPGGNGRPGF
jgi:HlyD family secretion protein